MPEEISHDMLSRGRSPPPVLLLSSELDPPRRAEIVQKLSCSGGDEWRPP
jgi:hypothetical protein